MNMLDHISGFKANLMEIRHHIHANPELGHNEFNTAELVASQLEAWGIESAMRTSGGRSTRNDCWCRDDRRDGR